MFGPRYDEWARNLVKTRPRLAGVYLVGLGAACFTVLYVVFRATGMGYFSFVPLVCVLFGGWLAVFGMPAKPAPQWYRHGMVAMIVFSLIGALTARTWLPLLLRR